MDIALRKDLILIQELIANPPAASAKADRHRRRHLSKLDLKAEAEEDAEEAKRQAAVRALEIECRTHLARARHRRASEEPAAACANCSHAHANARRRGSAHHRRAHRRQNSQHQRYRHLLLRLSSDDDAEEMLPRESDKRASVERDARASELTRRLRGLSVVAASSEQLPSTARAKYLSDIALNVSQQVHQRRPRGKTLTGGLTSNDLRSLVDSRRHQLLTSARTNDLRELEARARPSSACALVPTGSGSATDATAAGAYLPDAQLGDQVPVSSLLVPRCELSLEERQPTQQPAPKGSRLSPSGSVRSQTSRAARVPAGPGRQLNVWPRKAPAVRKSKQQTQKGPPSRISLLQLRNLVLKRTATASAATKERSSSLEGERGQLGAPENKAHRADGRELELDSEPHRSKVGGRRQERLAQVESGSHPAASLARAPNGTRLVQTKPLAPLDDCTQLYAIPKKKTCAALQAKQQVAGALKTAEVQVSRAAGSDESPDGSSSWDGCVDLVVSAGAEQAGEMASGQLIGVRGAGAGEPEHGKQWSLVDSIPGYSALLAHTKRPAARELQREHAIIDACLCGAPEPPYGARDPNERPVKKDFSCQTANSGGHQQTASSGGHTEIAASPLRSAGTDERATSNETSQSRRQQWAAGGLVVEARSAPQEQKVDEKNDDSQLNEDGNYANELIRPKSALSATSAELIKAQKSLAAAAAAKVHRDRMARMLAYHAEAYSNQRDCANLENLLTVRTNEIEESGPFWFSRSAGARGDECAGPAQKQADHQTKLLVANSAQPNGTTHRSGNNSAGMSDSSPSNNGAESDNSMQNSAETSADGLATTGATGSSSEASEPPSRAVDKKQQPNGVGSSSSPLGGILSRILHGNGSSNKRGLPNGKSNGNHPASSGSISSASPISSSSPSVNSSNRSPLTVVNGCEAGQQHQQASSQAKLDQLDARSRCPIVLARSNELQSDAASGPAHARSILKTAPGRADREPRAADQCALDAQFVMNGLPRVSSYTNMLQSGAAGNDLKVLNALPEVGHQVRAQAQNLCEHHALGRKLPAGALGPLHYTLGSTYCDYPVAEQQQAPSGYYANDFHEHLFGSAPPAAASYQPQQAYYHVSSRQYGDESIYIPPSFVAAAGDIKFDHGSKEGPAGTLRATENLGHARQQSLSSDGRQHHASSHINVAYYAQHPATKGHFLSHHHRLQAQQQQQQQLSARPSSSLDSILLSKYSYTANRDQEDNRGPAKQQAIMDCDRAATGQVKTTAPRVACRHDSASSASMLGLNGQRRPLHAPPVRCQPFISTVRTTPDRVHSDLCLEQNTIYAPGCDSSFGTDRQGDGKRGAGISYNTSGSSTNSNSGASQLTVLPATNDDSSCSAASSTGGLADANSGGLTVRLTGGDSCRKAQKTMSLNGTQQAPKNTTEIKAGKLTRVSIGSSESRTTKASQQLQAQNNGSRSLSDNIEQHSKRTPTYYNNEDNEDSGATIL